MSSTSRKRKSSTIQTKEGSSSKRARLLSSLWQSQEEVVDSIETSSSNSSRSVYQIKTIIGERPGEYLIDWADDPSTGRKFKADWQPKRNANTAAVSAWEKKRKFPVNSETSISKRHRRRRRPQIPSASSQAGVKAEIKASGKQNPEAQYSQQTTSYRTASKSTSHNNQTVRSTGNQALNIGTPNLSNHIVQTSQHSTLGRDLYIAYQSSISTPGTFKSILDHSDSGLEESFSEPDTPPPCASQGIIPDSQSLPGSSSYIPSTSTTHRFGNTPPSLKLRVKIQEESSSSSSSQQQTRSTRGSLNHEVLQIDDSINSSILETGESESLLGVTQDQASGTAEASAVVSSASLFSARVSSSSPAASNPTHVHRHDDHLQQHRRQKQHQTQPYYYQSHNKSAIHAYQNRVKHNAIVQPSHISISPAQSQADRGDFIQISDSTETSCKSLERPSTTFEPFVIAEDHTGEQHPSQATTTDGSFLSIRDPNSQSSHHNDSRQITVIAKINRKSRVNNTRKTSSSNFENQTLPDSVDSQEPPQPPPSSKNEMSDISSEAKGSREGLNTRAKLRKIREDGAKKLEDRRSQRQQSDLLSVPNSPSVGPNEVRPSTILAVSTVHPVEMNEDGRQRSAPLNNKATSISPQITQHASSFPINEALLQEQTKYQDFYGQQPMQQEHEQQQSSPKLTPANPGQDRRYHPSMPAAALHVRLQSPAQSQRASATPPVIPSKRPYESQEEPDRLEVEPVKLLKKAPLPAPNEQSIHNPIASGIPVAQEEPSLCQTETLEPIELGASEFVIPLAMPARIKGQYLNTVDHYRGSLIRNLHQVTVNKEVIKKLDQLLRRLANVSTHIGLEGGGPDSQEEVSAKAEAVYAEMSSAKFVLLGSLLARLRDKALHISIVVKLELLPILEFFLTGKDIAYAESGNLTGRCLVQGNTLAWEKVDFPLDQLTVSVKISGNIAPQTVDTKADLVVALDESFNAADENVIAIRGPTTNNPYLTPVVHLVGYSSVEHLVLCLPRALKGIARIRKLANYVCAPHTQEILGLVGPEDPSTELFAENIATCLQRLAGDPVGSSELFNSSHFLFPVRPIEDIPVMDTDSSLSDAMSETEIEELKNEADRYFPYHNLSTTRGDMRRQPGTRETRGSHDLDRNEIPKFGGVSDEEQLRKLNMVRPRSRPVAPGNPTNTLTEAKAREADLVKTMEIKEETIISLKYWAERRQGDYEDLRDKWSNLHHDKIELTADLEQKTKDWEKCRTEILSLKGERGALNQEIAALRLANLGHAIPTIADAERNAARYRLLEADKASLQKKNENLTKESTYIRDAYQQASSSAADLTNELAELKPELEKLRRTKDEFKSWRAAQKSDPVRKELREEVESLKSQLKSRDKMLFRKEKQVENLERGRAGVQTRGSSAQPRSPRAASRGASPAPGQLGGSAMAKGPSGLGARFNLGD